MSYLLIPGLVIGVAALVYGLVRFVRAAVAEAVGRGLNW